MLSWTINNFFNLFRKILPVKKNFFIFLIISFVLSFIKKKKKNRKAFIQQRNKFNSSFSDVFLKLNIASWEIPITEERKYIFKVCRQIVETKLFSLFDFIWITYVPFISNSYLYIYIWPHHKRIRKIKVKQQVSSNT